MQMTKDPRCELERLEGMKIAEGLTLHLEDCISLRGREKVTMSLWNLSSAPSGAFSVSMIPSASPAVDDIHDTLSALSLITFSTGESNA